MSESSSKKVELLCLIPSFAGGGAERVMLRLVSKLKENHTLALVVIEPVFEYPLPPGLTCHVLNKHGGPLMQVYRFAKLLRETRPATILSFLPAANFIAVMGALLVKKPRPRVVISERISQTSRTGLKYWAHRVLVKTAYRFADKVVAVTPQVGCELVKQGLISEKVVVIPNPIEIKKIQSLANERPSEAGVLPKTPFILAMGRLHPTKGFDLLIEAFADLSKKEGFENWQLLIVGSGPQREDLTKIISQKRLTSRIKLIPFMANPFPLLSAADLFVMPSRSEGFPNALLEALSLGKPCIAFDCPGGPRFVGEDSIELVPSGNVQVLAQKIMQVIRDPSLRQQLSYRAENQARKYDLALISSKYRDELGLV
jgi:glycosyltransferase involved in cell wall biosynthesis